MSDDQDESFKEEPDGQRPLKKARYVWQVKGKYHLKETFEPQNINMHQEDTSTTVAEENLLKHSEKTESEPEPVMPTKNNHQCSNKACIEALIEHSDNIMNTIQIPDNIDRSISDDIPITLVKPNSKEDDFYLRKWQARQVAKGFVDNTINKVLENWMAPPFDASDFVENCENDGQVEDEGILMAIQSHGLQSGGGKSIGAMDSSSKRIKPEYNHNESQCTCSHNLIHNQGEKFSQLHENFQQQIPFHKRGLNDLDTDYVDNDLYNFENVQNQLLHKETKSWSLSPMETECISSSTKENQGLNGIKKKNDDYNSISNSTSNEMKVDEHLDFLDAAVAVAIQKKGLTSYSYG